MNYENPVFFDVETSGLDYNVHEITQLAAFAPATGEELNLYVKFDVSKANKEALEVGHYDEKLWKRNAIEQSEACEEFNKFLCGHKSVSRVSKKGKKYAVSVLAGHNAAKFDMFFIIEAFKKHGVFLPADFRCYDTMQLALWGCLDLEDYTLGGLARHFNLISASRNLHNAAVDVEINALVAAYLLRSLRSPLPRWAKNLIRENIELNNIPF
jgi:DNA polymerase III alpha subunit (gram-positive type)